MSKLLHVCKSLHPVYDTILHVCGSFFPVCVSNLTFVKVYNPFYDTVLHIHDSLLYSMLMVDYSGLVTIFHIVKRDSATMLPGAKSRTQIP